MDRRARPPPPDASTLGVTVTAYNVGMIQANAFGKKQPSMVATLADYVVNWLNVEGPAVVGLNEIAPNIAELLEQALWRRGFKVSIATHESNSLLWRSVLDWSLSTTFLALACLPSPACPASCWCRLRCLPALPACPAWCWCLDAQRAVARLQSTHATHTHTHTHTPAHNT